MYEGLKGNDKHIVDTAFATLEQSGSQHAAAVFCGEREKLGTGSPLDFMILQSYTGSLEAMREGILGFYAV